MHISSRAASWPTTARFGFEPKIDISEGTLEDGAVAVLMIQGPSVAEAITRGARIPYRFIEVVQGEDCPEWLLAQCEPPRNSFDLNTPGVAERTPGRNAVELRIPICAPYYNDSLFPPAEPPRRRPRRTATRVAPTEAPAEVPAPEPVAPPETPTIDEDLRGIFAAAEITWQPECNAWVAPGLSLPYPHYPRGLNLSRPLVVVGPRFDMSKLPYNKVAGKVHFGLSSPLGDYTGNEMLNWGLLLSPIGTGCVRYDGCYDALIISGSVNKLPWWAKAIDRYTPPSAPSEWAPIARWPLIRYVVISPGGEVYIFTKPSLGTTDSGAEFYAGAHCITDKQLDSRIVSTDGEYRRYSAGLNGPHVGSDGEPCWGNAEGWVSSSDTATRVSIYLLYLTSANTSDSRGALSLSSAAAGQLLEKRKRQGVIE